jgi:hypothetical protein
VQMGPGPRQGRFTCQVVDTRLFTHECTSAVSMADCQIPSHNIWNASLANGAASWACAFHAIGRAIADLGHASSMSRSCTHHAPLRGLCEGGH